MPRNYEIMRTNQTQELCQEQMAYPYSYIGEDGLGYSYALAEIRRGIVVETEAEQAEAGDFPRNIQEHFWVRIGEHDGDNWISCGLLENGAYFFYEGGCDYTGFDCQGGMSLWISNSWKNIVDHAMTEPVYELYLQENEPEPERTPAGDSEAEEEDRGVCSHCEEAPATMPNEFAEDRGDLCADCFWDLDADMKRRRRADPAWRYNRAYSAAIVLFGKSEEEAHAMAATAVAGSR